MENLHIPVPSRNYLKSISLAFFIIIGIIFAGNASAQMRYKADGDIKISGGNQYSSTLASSLLEAKGDFTFYNGVLDEINTLKFGLPSSSNSSLNSDPNQIRLEITHTMVLPIMKKVFICAVLDNGTDSYKVSMDFDITTNKDQSITFNGTKTIKSASFFNFYQQPNVRFAMVSKPEEVQLNINLVFREIMEPVMAITVVKESINSPRTTR